MSYSRFHSPALGASQTLLRLLIALNWMAGLGIAALLITSLVAPEWLSHALGSALGGPESAAHLIAGERAIMVIGILGIPINNIVFMRLLAIVDSVGDGDPFITANARRLRTIAWSILALELLHGAVGLIAWAASTKAVPLDIKWKFSFTGWLAVLLLFVLARVFESGAQMREDIAATI